MSVFDQLFRDGFSSVYLTLASIIQSLAAGYLFQTLTQEYFKTGRVSTSTILDSMVVLISIVAVWQEYAISCIAFTWRIDILDSLIPFLLGLSEFAMVTTIAARSSSEAIPIVRTSSFEAWLWAVASFLLFSAAAYVNYAAKGVLRADAAALQSLPLRHLWWAVGSFVIVFSVLLWHRRVPLQQFGQHLVRGCLTAGFIFHLIRIGYAHKHTIP
ncbi:hypothetical protein [Prosthecobacter fluviatilis]|uniref:Uncharacterized protein n=1 Tax=Prosthecobacter fluviatilis TaxID=445931 RepID=A0ABW0KVC1_9BACT